MQKKQGENTYDRRIFEWIQICEEKHFWFLVRKKYIFDKLKKAIPPPARILEIGCGCGNVSSFLAHKGYQVVGCDYFYEALNRSRNGFKKIQADALSLPFKDGSFDIVGLFDILEHFSDDSILLKEALRIVRENGFIILTVPAKRELWSNFDVLSSHKRRYSKEQLNKMFLDNKVKLLSIDYMFTFLYLLMKFIRLNKNKTLEEEFKINRLVNMGARSLFELERVVSFFYPLPIGTSIIVTGKK